MKKTIIMLMGRSGSGKSHLERALVSAHPDEFYKVVSVTTRAPREKEKDGIDYTFVDEEKFDGLDLVQSVAFADNKYGSELSQYKTEHPYAILVVLPESASKLKKALSERMPDAQVVFVYFDITVRTLKKNMLNRGDSLKAIHERLRKDTIDEEFEQHIGKADFVIRDGMLTDELVPFFYDWLTKKSSRIYIHPEDIIGNKIEVGDIIAYPMRKRNALWMSMATVMGIKYQSVRTGKRDFPKSRAMLKVKVAANRWRRVPRKPEGEFFVVIMKSEISNWHRSVVLPVADVHDYSDNEQMRKLMEIRRRILRGRKQHENEKNSEGREGQSS
jgi:guanylate kinase